MKRFELFSIGILAGITACGTPPMGTATGPDHDAEQSDQTDSDDSDDSDDSPPSDPQSDDDGVDDEPDEEPPIDEFKPVDGAWVTVSEAMSHDGCSMEEWVMNDPGQTMDIAVVSGSSFELVDARVNLQCEYDQAGFDCQSSSITDSTPRDDFGLNATLVLDLETYGDFDGPGLLTMHTEITTNCSGSDCWLVSMATSSFPCEMALMTVAEAR